MPRTFFALCVWGCLLATGFSQETDSVVRADIGDAIRMALHPQAAPVRLNEYRLLPSDADTKTGNAAVVMLRISFEQQAFINGVLPKVPALLELEHDDPQIAAEFHFNRFYRQLARAAYIRDADWQYPLDDAPLWGILLPDAQAMRMYVDRGLRLHCGILIAAGKLVEARECILVQLACARHLARTPLLVNRLIAESICRSAVDRLEILVVQPNSPNLYWALAMLPEAIADDRASLQWEAEGLIRSIASLGTKSGFPPIGHEDWNQIAEQFSKWMVVEMGGGMTALEAATLQAKLLTIAHKELEHRKGYNKATRDKMLPTELVMRWVLMTNDDVHADAEAAFSMPPPVAIKRLQTLDIKCQSILEETGAPAAPFRSSFVNIYLTMHEFDRSVKQLQIVEAIRDHASRTGKLPEKLDDVELHCPIDPLTGKPFEYRVANTQAFLSPAEIPGLGANFQRRKTYRVKIAAKE